MKIKKGTGAGFIFKPETYYAVQVKLVNDYSDLQNAIFYSGWISPSGASACLWKGNFEEAYFGDIHFMDVIKEVEFLK